MDEFLRLDLAVGRLLEEVDRRVGLDRVIVGLSADHGVLPLVENLQARGVAARRVRTDEILGPVTRALEARYGSKNGFIARFMAPHFYFDLDGLARRGVSRHEVEEVAEQALLETGLVQNVYTNARLLGDPPSDDPLFPLVRRSFFQPRSPHLIVILKEWLYLTDRPGGTSHGTPFEYDRHVPIIFLGTGVRPGTYAAACGPEDIAPTLAALLRLDYPLQDADRVLAEALRGE
jgi:arylsulfatase A-like enzyme